MSDDSYKRSAQYYRMKANQHWEMAGLARADGDKADEQRHTAKAREFDKLASEATP